MFRPALAGGFAMLRFVLTVLLAILTLALFVHLLTRNAPFRAAVLALAVHAKGTGR